jgi:hypothetical protein
MFDCRICECPLVIMTVKLAMTTFAACYCNIAITMSNYSKLQENERRCSFNPSV